MDWSICCYSPAVLISCNKQQHWSWCSDWPLRAAIFYRSVYPVSSKQAIIGVLHWKRTTSTVSLRALLTLSNPNNASFYIKYKHL